MLQNIQIITVITSSIILCAYSQSYDTPLESHAQFKRGIELGDVSYHFAHTDFGDKTTGAHVKTITVVRKLANKPKLNDMPENMLKMPNGNTVQYWPADMRSDMQTKIKVPLPSAVDTTSYGYYTSYTTTHDTNNEVKIVYDPRIETSTIGQNTAPIQFPPTDSVPNKERKVVSVGTKLQSINKPNENELATNWQSYKEITTTLKPLNYESQLNDYLYRDQLAKTQYEQFINSCYKLSKSGQYAFAVSDDSEELLGIAAALSLGDVKLVKELAGKLTISEKNSSSNDDVFNSFEYSVPFSTSTEASLSALNEVTPSSSTTTVRAPYTVPRGRYRKRINRRPKIPERLLVSSKTNPVTVPLPSIVTTESAITQKTINAEENTEQQKIINQRSDYYYY